MDSALKKRLRAKYVQLNRKFLSQVENGSSWEELHPLMEEMKEIAACLERIPEATAIVRPMQFESDSEQQVI